jgi:diguanylate cyclase (GGDEF)-like protein
MSRPKRILVVDDDSSSRIFLARTLERRDFQVLLAGDGHDAEAVAKQEQPDVILMDIVMPGRDGLETCRVLKADQRTAEIPVIFVTSASDDKRIAAGFEAGGSDYITKPFTRQELIARITVHANLRDTQKTLLRKNSELEQISAELAEISRIDPLTRLLNRRAWDKAASTEHQRFTRNGHPYSVIMVDIDHFKAYNDHCGHQAGDECLRMVAETLQQTCRQVDSVGRYGGEEFVVLTPETDVHAGPRFAERLRKAIWSLAIPHPASITAGRLTASVGVATCQGGNWEEVLREADSALYVAKRAGRNMVFAASNEKFARMQQAQVNPVVTGSIDDPDQAKVLVVDDEATNRAVCRGALRNAGYEVLEADCGAKALLIAEEARPDVILMDIMMPGMDGLECTRRLRSSAETSDIPVIMISALGSNEDVLRGLKSGADEYLTKPIRATELNLRVRSMVRLHREQMDLLRSYESRGAHMRTLTQLVDFCRLVGLSNDVDGVLEATVEAVAEVGRSQRVSIMLPDEKGVLRIARSIGVPEDVISTARQQSGDAVAGMVYYSARAIVANDPAESTIHGQRDDVACFVSSPLIASVHGAVTEVMGVLNVTQQRDDRPYMAHELEYIELISKISGSAIHNLQMRDAYDRASHSVMVALAKLAEYRDNDTGQHLDRVTRYCVLLAETLRGDSRYKDQINDAFLDHLRRSVPLHDIGKVAIPDSILLHPGKLTSEQFELMKTHTVVGAATIQTLIDVAPPDSLPADRLRHRALSP